MNIPTYKVGDIVYLKNSAVDLNWKLTRVIHKPFVVANIPENTKKFKTYTLRLLDDPASEECWIDYHLHEDFFSRGQEI